MNFGTAKLLSEEQSEVLFDLYTMLYSLGPIPVSISAPVLSNASLSSQYDVYEALYHIQLLLLAQLPCPINIVPRSEQPSSVFFTTSTKSCPFVSVQVISKGVLTAKPSGRDQCVLLSMLELLSSMLSVPCDSSNLIGCSDVRWLMEVTASDESACLSLVSEFATSSDTELRFVSSSPTTYCVVGSLYINLYD